MAGHLHKSFSDQQVKALLERYVGQEVKLEHILGALKIGRTRFFEILKVYRAYSQGFTVAYQRKNCPRKLAPEIEKNILWELRFEKQLIGNPDVPRRSYNYSYVRDRLREGCRQKVSVPTIIRRAKEHDFYLSNPSPSGRPTTGRS